MESAKKVELIETLDGIGYDVVTFNEVTAYGPGATPTSSVSMTLTIKPKAV